MSDGVKIACIVVGGIVALTITGKVASHLLAKRLLNGLVDRVQDQEG